MKSVIITQDRRDRDFGEPQPKLPRHEKIRSHKMISVDQKEFEALSKDYEKYLIKKPGNSVIVITSEQIEEIVNKRNLELNFKVRNNLIPASPMIYQLQKAELVGEYDSKYFAKDIVTNDEKGLKISLRR